jgi:cell division septation protein DedD
MNISANVVSSCSFDSTASSLLSVTCALDTPVATSSVAADPGAPQATTPNTAGGSSPTPTTGTPIAATTPAKSTPKLCNALAASKLENQSFNQFIAALERKSDAPPRYFSTFQVCF